ncbi:phosphoribosyltransferase-like protein [Mucilaginibacter gotjawali]|uniref:Hypoxanthine phosphoribosyltransferase n=1 Tax=Mucilaginibacter gotjawali TaxID=1550579 RepID=A0A839S9V5_9SPHI|nr:hypothetical protein [Mucilaginibacter gotjawali]MBB3054785.1 hypoxanthine phosphoribosyltransferase [Mucilaginibacter gotjawali]
MKDFSLQNFIRLKELFQNKRWYKNHDEQEVFRRFGFLLGNLNEIEQELILDLSSRYLWVSYGNYLGILKDLFVEFSSEDISNVKHIYFFPIIKPDDEPQTKSGNVVSYLYKSIVYGLPANLRSIPFTIFEQFEKIAPESFTLKEGELLILIDDFIGSGTTISNTFKEIDKNPSIEYQNIRIFTITLMQEAMNILAEKGINFYCKYIESKGITDYYGDMVTQKKAIMKKIERMTKAGSNYKMGFKKSEALVTMARTPNNTFSIFWSDHIKEGKEFLAPFKR